VAREGVEQSGGQHADLKVEKFEEINYLCPTTYNKNVFYFCIKDT
jgi:hypothetical protein